MTAIENGVAVITGAASGIGLATAKRLARAGMHVVSADVDGARLTNAVDEVAALGPEPMPFVTDVTSLSSVQALADAAYDRFGRVDVLFNNAGVAVTGPISEMTHDDWRWTIDVDLWGPIHGVEAFLPRMIEQGGPSHIVNTSSFAGMVPNIELGPYCVAKYGVVALSEVLARECREHDIGVSVVCPMRIESDIDRSARNRQDSYGGAPDHLDLDLDDEQLAGRMLGADEVAEQVLDAIRTRRLYVFTHEESRAFIRRRFDRIDASFGRADRSDVEG